MQARITDHHDTGQRGADERRSGDERRACPDRRSGLDRRGTGFRSPLSREPRPYAFRELDERRDAQDRRVYGHDGTSWDRRRQRSSAAANGGFDGECPNVCLTAEEIRALLADVDG